MPYVAIAPASGMGNQLFMMSAALGYAERWGHEPVFWEEPHSSWEHQGSAFRIRAMFPNLRVLTAEERAGSWTILKEPWDSIYTYNPLPHIGENVKLEGYFQSDFYGPSKFPTPPSPPSLRPELICHRWSDTFFLHVRRGDYLHPANTHHAVDLREYWRTCVAEMVAKGGLTAFVVSDDIEWCKTHLHEIVGNVGIQEWLWCPTECTDVETFFWMTLCGRGGVCANSTFSWWAAWYLKHGPYGSNVHIFMPRVWGHPPLPPTRHLYPSWALVR